MPGHAVNLGETQTLNHLKEAYRREAQANMRYPFGARLADMAQRPDIAQVLRAAADEERGHALGFLDLLVEHGAAAPELVCGKPGDDLRGATAADRSQLPAPSTRAPE